MPLKIPTLDDRTYADLVREGIERIPAVAPEWTNHNASDPGITLLELFAYLTEIYLYRLDRVTAANKAKFVKLLEGTDLPGVDEGRLRGAVRQVRTRSRAVTCDDFEHLAVTVLEERGQGAAVAAARCFAGRNLTASSAAERRRDRPGHVTVVIVPSDHWMPEADLAGMAREVRTALEPFRLLTCRLHVVPPRYVNIAVRIRVAVAPSDVQQIERRIGAAIAEEYGLWPLGRTVYSSDLYRRLASVQGVLRVLAIEWTPVDPARLLHGDAGETVGIHLDDGELPRVAVSGVTWDIYS